jgi:hypothetical protein
MQELKLGEDTCTAIDFYGAIACTDEASIQMRSFTGNISIIHS